MAGAPMLTVVDLVIVAVVVLAAMHGWRLGLSGFAFGLAGLVAGGLVGLWIAGWLIGTHWSPPVHLLLGLGCVVVAALLGSAIGARLGGAAGHLLNRTHLRLPDRAVGAAVRGALALGVCWLLAAAVTAIGAPTPVVSAVQDSAVLRQVSDALPSPTELVADLSTQLQLPADLAGLVPNSGVGTLPAAQVSAASAAAAPSVVKIEGTGCGSVEGSGFVTDGGLVVTNAHVVAGATALTVTDRRGTHRAESLIVDGAADIAVLRADSVQAPALSLTTEPVANGTPAVILGYPGDGALTAVPAVVVQKLPVLESRIGGTGLVSREVYRLAATVRPGNSGGPLLDTSGQVIGVVNARSLTNNDTGFALTLDPLRADLAAATAGQVSVDAATAACSPAR